MRHYTFLIAMLMIPAAPAALAADASAAADEALDVRGTGAGWGFVAFEGLPAVPATVQYAFAPHDWALEARFGSAEGLQARVLCDASGSAAIELYAGVFPFPDVPETLREIHVGTVTAAACEPHFPKSSGPGALTLTIRAAGIGAVAAFVVDGTATGADARAPAALRDVSPDDEARLEWSAPRLSAEGAAYDGSFEARFGHGGDDAFWLVAQDVGENGADRGRVFCASVDGVGLGVIIARPRRTVAGWDTDNANPLLAGAAADCRLDRVNANADEGFTGYSVTLLSRDRVGEARAWTLRATVNLLPSCAGESMNGGGVPPWASPVARRACGADVTTAPRLWASVASAALAAAGDADSEAFAVYHHARHAACPTVGSAWDDAPEAARRVLGPEPLPATCQGVSA